MENKLLTVAEASVLLRLREKTMRKWLAERRVSYAKVGGVVRIPAAEIDRLLNEGTIARRQA